MRATVYVWQWMASVLLPVWNVNEVEVMVVLCIKYMKYVTMTALLQYLATLEWIV